MFLNLYLDFKSNWDYYICLKELETFISQSTSSHVLLKKFDPLKHERLRNLSDPERRAIIREGVNLLIKKYTYHPEHEHKHSLALAIIQIFPQLKTTNSKIEGVVKLFHL